MRGRGVEVNRCRNRKTRRNFFFFFFSLLVINLRLAIDYYFYYDTTRIIILLILSNVASIYAVGERVLPAAFSRAAVARWAIHLINFLGHYILIREQFGHRRIRCASRRIRDTNSGYERRRVGIVVCACAKKKKKKKTEIKTKIRSGSKKIKIQRFGGARAHTYSHTHSSLYVSTSTTTTHTHCRRLSNRTALARRRRHGTHAKTTETSKTVHGVIDGKWWTSARVSGNQPNWN